MWKHDEPAIEFVMLAEHAEVIHGKLYIMGGGWDSITVQDFQAPLILPLAVSMLVPWQATNRPHTVTISIQSADAAVLAAQQRHLTVGRPAEIEPGTSQRSLLVLRVPVQLPGPGRYVAIASVNDTSETRVAFRALAPPRAT
jgi:hypothetical protein